MAQLRKGSLVGNSPIIGGVGTIGYLPLFLDSTVIGQSNISDDGTNVHIEGGLNVDNESVFSKPVNIHNLGSTDDVKIMGFSENSGDVFSLYGDFAGSGEPNNLIKFKTGWGKTPMAWRGDGNVGVGTTSLDSAKMTIENDQSVPTLMLDRAIGQPTIKASSSDGQLVLDASDGGGVYLNNYTSGSVMLAKGGGNVGVGDLSPTQKLEVQGNAKINGVLYFNDTNTKLEESEGDALKLTTSSGYLEFGAKSTSYMHFYTDRSTFFFNKSLMVDSGNIGSYNEDLSLKTSGTTRIIVKNDTGNVGIGTTNPYYKQHLMFDNGDAIFSGGATGNWGGNGVRIENINSTNVVGAMSSIQLRVNDADAHISAIYKASNDIDLGLFFEGEENFRFTKDGKMGVGTSTPSEKLEVYDGNLRISNSDNPATLILRGDRSNVGDGANQVDSRIDFLHDDETHGIRMNVYNDSAKNHFEIQEKITNAYHSRLYIQGDTGNVGIGTSTPSQKLDIASGHIDMDNNYGIGYGIDSSTDKFIIKPRRDGIRSLVDGSDAPNDISMSLESDCSITFIETDANKVVGWMDLNSNSLRWKGSATFDNNVEVKDSASFENGTIRIGDGFGTGGNSTIHKYNADLYLQYNNGQASANVIVGGYTTSGNILMRKGDNTDTITLNSDTGQVSAYGGFKVGDTSLTHGGSGANIYLKNEGGTWWQRFRTNDSSDLSSSTFVFEERQNSGDYVALMSINGYGYLTTKSGINTTEISLRDDSSNITFDDDNTNAKNTAKSTGDMGGIIKMRADNNDTKAVVQSGAFVSNNEDGGFVTGNYKMTHNSTEDALVFSYVG